MYSIGVDIGGTSAKIGIVVDNKITHLETIPTNIDIDYDYFVQSIFKVIDGLRLKMNNEKPKIIGISSCGLIDTKKGSIVYSNNIRWDNKNIVKTFEDKYLTTVKIANDAKCALLAEAVLGDAKNYTRVCMITLGTGVGGGFIKNKSLDSSSFSADVDGILGHTILVSKGKECTCGNKGCFEAYCSATALINSYREKTGIELNAKEICDKVRNKDEIAMTVFQDYKNYLVDGLVSISNILRPDIIVIGGGLSKSSDLYIDYLCENVNCKLYGGTIVPIKIVRATLENDAGIIGATLL